MSEQIERIAGVVGKHEVRIAALEKRVKQDAMVDLTVRNYAPLPPAVARVVECAVEWHKALVGMKAPPEQALSDAVAAYKETLR